MNAPSTAEPADSGARPATAVDARSILGALDSGRLRAAHPDADAPGGWRVDPTVKAAIIARFADREVREWEAAGVFRFRDRVGLPLRDLAPHDGDDDAERGPLPRIVPGGTTIRAGTHLGRGVVIMPPSFVNVGAWIGDDAMIDSHVLVGSCAQIGDRVHLAAGVQIGGVLEPPAGRPVIVEDDAFVGAGAILLDGVLVGRAAVIAAGVTLTGTSRVYDTVRETVLVGTPEAPLTIPAGVVIVPGTRSLPGGFAASHGLGVSVAVIVKDRDDRTSARVALEEALR